MAGDLFDGLRDVAVPTFEISGVSLMEGRQAAIRPGQPGPTFFQVHGGQYEGRLPRLIARGKRSHSENKAGLRVKNGRAAKTALDEKSRGSRAMRNEPTVLGRPA
jgi:hypothetical protein